jgi:predicted TIM-barrel fold metal-dependent hydrolase
MRQGFRVIDADTHVYPALDVLLRYADKDLLDRAGELTPYTRREGEHTSLSIAPIRYNRVAGSKQAAAVQIQAGAANNLAGRTRMRTKKPIAPEVAETNARGRLADMDEEGADVHFIIAGPWAYAAPALSQDLTLGLYRAYHRYMAEYCSADPRRLKGHIIAPGNNPEWAAQTIHELAGQDWVAAVWPTLPLDLPIDDPDLDPIWQAAQEADLPIMYHGFTVEPPYYPGYRDIWGNAAMSRAAGQVWGGQRFLTFMLISGILDRYPELRVGTLECGHGWLPHWLQRIGRQIDYVAGAVPADLKHTPIEYAQAGRVFCGIDVSEGPAMTKAVIDLLGDGVLMYLSDYPHPETLFPETVDTVLAWQDVLGEAATRRLMSENAARFYRLSTTPWSSASNADRSSTMTADVT